MKSTSCSPSVGGLQKRQEGTCQRFGLLFGDKVARIGDHLRFNILKVRTQQFTHVRNGILPAYCQETDRDFIPELLLVEIHVVEDPPAVVESRIHSSISRVCLHIGGNGVRGNCSWFVHFVPVPPSDIDVLFALDQLSGQIGKHHENEVPFPLVIGKLNVVQQRNTRDSRFDQRERLEIVGEEKSPAVGTPCPKIVSDDMERRAQVCYELMKDPSDIFGSCGGGKDSRIPETRQVCRNG